MTTHGNGWKMKEMCDNCPFRTDGNQIRVTPERLEDIKEGQHLGQPFYCHKTVHYDDDDYEDEEPYERRGDELECAGAVAFRDTVTMEDRAAAMTRLMEAVERKTGV